MKKNKVNSKEKNRKKEGEEVDEEASGSDGSDDDSGTIFNVLMCSNSNF